MTSLPYGSADGELLSSAKPLLLVDFDSGGHHAMYLRHLVRYGLAETGSTIKALITSKLLNRTLALLNPTEQEILLKSVELLDDDPIWKRIEARISKKTIACWLYFEYLNLRRREGIVLLYIDSIFYGLALSPLPRWNVSGLLFRPTFYYQKRKMLMPGVRPAGMFALKWMSSFVCRLRPGLRKIFTLDPLAEDYARTVWGTRKFECVPDPLGPEPGEARPVGKLQRGPKAKLRLLLAGMLSPRKGLKEIVDAFEASEAHLRSALVFSVIGEPEEGCADYVRTHIDRAVALGVQVFERLNFFGEQELEASMLASDLVLAPYRGFKGSSAIVIRAAHFGKPVICADEGLLGYFVRTHCLGAAIEVANAAVFAGVLKSFLESGVMPGFDPISARKYADDSEPRLFVRRILEIESAEATNPARKLPKPL